PQSPTLSAHSQRPKNQKSRTLRSAPVLPNAIIGASHNIPGSASHQRKYVLLREKSALPLANNSGENSSASSPKLGAVTSGSQANASIANASNKPRPFVRKVPSTRYIFSVDDDEDEVEEDLNREYLEGYTDALRHRFKKTSLVNAHEASLSSDPKTKKNEELEKEIAQNLISATKDINILRERDGDPIHKINSRLSIDSQADNTDEISNQPQNMQSIQSQLSDFAERSGNISEDNSSKSSSESFTLRERQDAINETHPFGIRIWKPAIYKKNRSVELAAENDIHSRLPSTKQIGPSVVICNFIWSCTVGLLLMLICLSLGLITSIFAIFTNQKKDDSMRYAKLFFNLGSYLFVPFGKLVLLRSEKHYLQEDANVGSSLADYRQWRTQEEGRLFYASPNALKRVPPTEVTPLNPQAATTATVDPRKSSSDDDDDDDENTRFYKQRFFGRGKWNIGRVIFFLLFYLIIYPILLTAGFCLWLMVFTIPMAKVLFILCNHIKRHPLALTFEAEKNYSQHKSTGTESILICTYRSLGFHYYKYTVDGTNIFFINMIFLVIFTIGDFFLLKEYFELNSLIVDPSLIFTLCLISIIPLAYFIGQAVASISAQTSMGLGAVINAFFSTIVEVFLYCVALNQSKGKLVEGSMIGSILGAVLLLPGMSMCGGAIKRKTQRYNPASAGVSSTMLLYAILVMLSPTILYEIYGKYEVQCFACDDSLEDGGIDRDCKRCHIFQASFTLDSLYTEYLRPFTVFASVVLFLAYCIGLWFTLKTHAALIWSTPVAAEREKEKKLEHQASQMLNTPDANSIKSLNLDNLTATQKKQNSYPSRSAQKTISTMPSMNLQQQPSQLSVGANTSTKQQQQTPQQQGAQAEEGGGHDAPNWSRTKSTTILLLATVLYAIIAEILVDVVDDVLSVYPISPKLLGLTVFALIPNTTEFVNAISFAMHGNVALSMEIGSAYVLQVCLLQIPIVTLYSVFKNRGINADIASMFTLIFPRWDFMAALISVYMFTYIYAEGKSNYFKGSILILLYFTMIVGFYCSISIDDNGL
ncbi:hypothetical protein CANARDRAFT_187248, partial [[Candida] arabinofermentans NRRL YB-2248]